ncbi:zinc finger BED domain-containing protein RICESLEEPER 2-like [Neltuma alba]|uniref:zinc finger BED domain-containing protein RICESLEEPER 2-like n=1 Tax=Neltuma alba TaxID=207710 RepID=UPI0010A2C22C|nr:zinc finger BED domain-containing protein RICESLEEPER 2-like [Prosopis alba]
MNSVTNTTEGNTGNTQTIEENTQTQSQTTERASGQADNEDQITTSQGEEEGDESNVDGSRKRKKSLAWLHFEKLPPEQWKNGEPRAKCKYCPTTIACHPTTHGTGGLVKHLQRCPRNPHRANKLKQCMFSTGASGKSLTHHVFRQDFCRRALVKFLILEEQPFRIVEGEGFKELLRALEPRFQIPSRATVTRDCLKLYYEEARRLKRYFKTLNARVSLTTDTWTSNQNTNYMCLTARWIDDHWAYQRRILNFCVVENHQGDTIAAEIERCLLFWGIDKLFTITVDNASSNDIAISTLKDVLKHWNGLVCNGEFLHLRCCAHILNLIVSDGVKEMHRCIEAIRNAIKYVRSSPARFRKFKDLVEKMKIDSKSLLSMDCLTRWDSTYMMLENAIKFSSVFERMAKEDRDYTNHFLEKNLIGPPDAYDLRQAKVFCSFLQEFHGITLQFSGSTTVTSNICFQNIVDVFTILNEHVDDPNSLLCEMAMRMKIKYDKYWGDLQTLNPLLVIAVVLDPRYKMKYLTFAVEEMFQSQAQREHMLKIVSTVLYQLYDCYSGGLDTSQFHMQIQGQRNRQAVSETTSASTCASEQSGSTITSMHRKRSARRFVARFETETQSDKYAEVEKYLQAELVKAHELDFDILAWWNLNAMKYKVLSMIARDVLAMPVSIVSSESAFSTGGRVIDDFRSSLSSKMVEALICT